MKNKIIRKKLAAMALALGMVMTVTACGSSDTSTTGTAESEETSTASDTAETTDTVLLDTSSLFTDRDMEQEADTSEAVTYTVSDGEDITITEEGVYVITGTASEVTIYVEADEEAKVQIVLDGVNITNTDTAVICVNSADKVFVTTSADSSLTVTDAFSDDTGAVVYSESDIVFNGTSALTIDSSEIGVYTKDDLKITGGTYDITAETVGLRANDSIRIADGDITINAGTDGIHAEHKDDDTKGYIYIADGTIDITCGDDGIHGQSVVLIDGGTISLEAYEGIEGTYVQINGGTLDIDAVDDGINAGDKSESYDTVIEITGGDIVITVEAEKTDAIDSNGDLIISGGTIDITADSAFDYIGTGTLTDAVVTLNGETVTELTPSDY